MLISRRKWRRGRLFNALVATGVIATGLATQAQTPPVEPLRQMLDAYVQESHDIAAADSTKAERTAFYDEWLTRFIDAIETHPKSRYCTSAIGIAASLANGVGDYSQLQSLASRMQEQEVEPFEVGYWKMVEGTAVSRQAEKLPESTPERRVALEFALSLLTDATQYLGESLDGQKGDQAVGAIQNIYEATNELVRVQRSLGADELQIVATYTRTREIVERQELPLHVHQTLGRFGVAGLAIQEAQALARSGQYKNAVALLNHLALRPSFSADVSMLALQISSQLKEPAASEALMEEAIRSLSDGSHSVLLKLELASMRIMSGDTSKLSLALQSLRDIVANDMVQLEYLDHEKIGLELSSDDSSSYVLSALMHHFLAAMAEGHMDEADASLQQMDVRRPNNKISLRLRAGRYAPRGSGR